jgi:hypothetical protein
MSMSMSLSMSMDYGVSTPAPSSDPGATGAPAGAETDAPTGPPTSEFELPASNDSITCNDQLPKATTQVHLEVDTSLGVTEAEYTEAIASALTDALGATHTFCISSPERMRRKLEDLGDFVLGDPQVSPDENGS